MVISCEHASFVFCSNNKIVKIRTIYLQGDVLHIIFYNIREKTHSPVSRVLTRFECSKKMRLNINFDKIREKIHSPLTVFLTRLEENGITC